MLPDFGARFYELLGYALAVLSFGILLAAVVWRLRLSVAERHRKLFLVASFSGLSILCVTAVLLLAMSQSGPSGTIGVQRPGKPNVVSGGVGSSRGDEPSDVVPTCVVYVKADGTVLLEGETLTVEQLVIHLRHNDADKRLNISLRPDAKVRFATVVQVFDQLKKIGAEQISFQVGHAEQQN